MLRKFYWFFRIVAYLLCIAGILFYLDRSTLLGSQGAQWGLLMLFVGFIFFFISYVLYFLLRSRRKRNEL